MLLWALSWPLLLADVAWLGNGFEFLPLFMVMAVVARQTPVAVLGASLAALTHPEQALFAFIALLILSLAAEFRFARSRAILGTAFAFASTVGTTLWLMSSGVESRTTFFVDWVADSLALFIRNLHLLAYSGWGAWWVLLLLAIGLLGRCGVQLLIVSAVLIPLAFTATTIDGTRVFAGVASAVGIAVYVFVHRALTVTPEQAAPAPSDRFALLGVTFLAVLILPNLQVIMWGDIIGPGAFWIDLARSITAG